MRRDRHRTSCSGAGRPVTLCHCYCAAHATDMQLNTRGQLSCLEPSSRAVAVKLGAPFPSMASIVPIFGETIIMMA
jgi:hypothetical protein